MLEYSLKYLKGRQKEKRGKRVVISGTLVTYDAYTQSLLSFNGMHKIHYSVKT